MTAPTSDSKGAAIRIAGVLNHYLEGAFLRGSDYVEKDTDYKDLAEQANAEILAILAQEVNKARIDEWDYIETLRETSDDAMYESMQRRIKELERLG